MAAEVSVYENRNGTRAAQAFGVCFGRVTGVDTAKRTCTVKTFSSVPQLNDLHVKSCQWICLDASPKGDESMAVPRRGAIALVMWVDGEPFVLGYFKGLNTQLGADGKQKGAVTGLEAAPTLTEGDKVISTAAGNKITVKASGLIEIVSGETLKTVYLPTTAKAPATLRHLTREYELKTDGGFEKWSGNIAAQLNQKVFRRDLAASFVVVEERGAVDGAVIYRTAIAPGLAGLAGPAMYKHEVDITGESRITVGPGVPTHTQQIAPDGTWTVEAFGGFKLTSKLGKYEVETVVGDISVKSTSGNVSVETQAGNISAKTTAGNVDVEATAGAVSVKATAGDLMLEGSGGKLKLGKGMVGMGSAGVELLELFANTLQEIGNILTAIGAMTHMGNLGYPTSPPINVADFVKVQVKITEIMTKLTTITGGV